MKNMNRHRIPEEIQYIDSDELGKKLFNAILLANSLKKVNIIFELRMGLFSRTESSQKCS